MPYYVLDDISRTKGVTRKCPVHFQVTQGVLLDCVMTNFKPLFSVNDMPVISPLSRYLATGQRERLNSCLSKGQDCKRNVQCLTNSVFLSSNRDAPNTHHPPSHIGKKKKTRNLDGELLRGKTKYLFKSLRKKKNNNTETICSRIPKGSFGF